MGFLIGQIIAFLAGAALIGLFIGWALFGGRKAAAAPASDAAAPPPPPPAPGVDAEALKKAESRAKELAAEREGLAANLSERDDEIAQLRHQIAQAEQYRVESATRVEQLQTQVGSLQDQLRARDADLALAGSAVDDLAAAELSVRLREREAELKRLQLAYDELKQVAGPDAPAIAELKAQVAELRAVLESGDDLAPAAGADDEQINRLLEQNAKLSEENLGLKAAYDAAERSLEEQDGAMDQLSHVLLKSQQECSALKQQVGELRAKLGLPPLPEPPASRTVPRPTTTPVATAPIATPPVGPPPPPPPAPKPTAPATPAAPAAPAAPPVVADDAADEATMAIPAFDLPDEAPPAPPTPPTPPPAEAASPPPAPKVLTGPPKVEALEGPPPTPALEGPPPLKAIAAPVAAAEPQDLKAIKGIGPATEKRLHAAGVVSWAQIAALEGDALEALAEQVKVSADKIRKDEWVEQARALQAGG